PRSPPRALGRLYRRPYRMSRETSRFPLRAAFAVARKRRDCRQHLRFVQAFFERIFGASNSSIGRPKIRGKGKQHFALCVFSDA
ncbi:hypothetical protein, partial [Burkholderia pseudomallei]|uniref:hypothetical protein n=5 Tax=Burkholderia pseudomallei TaxID=28450 RepID=UPI001E601821